MKGKHPRWKDITAQQKKRHHDEYLLGIRIAKERLDARREGFEFERSKIVRLKASMQNDYYDLLNVAFKERMRFAEERLAHEFIKAIIPYMDISHETHGPFERFTAELQVADPFKRKF